MFLINSEQRIAGLTAKENLNTPKTNDLPKFLK
jgi:hypothetical protein